LPNSGWCLEHVDECVGYKKCKLIRLITFGALKVDGNKFYWFGKPVPVGNQH